MEEEAASLLEAAVAAEGSVHGQRDERGRFHGLHNSHRVRRRGVAFLVRLGG